MRDDKIIAIGYNLHFENPEVEIGGTQMLMAGSSGRIRGWPGSKRYPSKALIENQNLGICCIALEGELGFSEGLVFFWVQRGAHGRKQYIIV